MIRLFVRYTARLLAGAVLVHAAAVHGQQISIQVVGAGAVCSGFTLGGSAANPTLTCIPVSGPQPFNCAITGAPTSAVAPGTAVNLQVNCGGGTTPYRYLWSPGNSTASSLSVAPTVTTSYSVTATDSANAQIPLSANVQVSTGGGGGGGGGPISCPGFNNTIVLDMNFNNPTTLRQTAITQSDAVVVRITTGPAGGYAWINAAESGGGAAERYATVSDTACDFGRPPAQGWIASSQASTVNILFSDGPNDFGYAHVPPNSTGYFNVKTLGSCGSNCGLIFQLTPAH